MICPTVSVVITAYNAECWIAETLNSVLNQTYNDYEVIVVDDGSTDHTANVIQQFGEKVHYIYTENVGQPAARNIGIRAARGDWIAFNDADDLWLSNKLSAQLHAIEDDPYKFQWSYTDAFAFHDDPNNILYRFSKFCPNNPNGYIERDLLLGNWIPSVTVMIKKNVFDHVGNFDESPDLLVGEDWHMWLKIAQHYPIHFLAEPLAYVRKHTKNITRSTNSDIVLKGMLEIARQATSRNPQLVPILPATEARLYRDYARTQLNNGNTIECRAALIQSLQRKPTLYSLLSFLATLLPSSWWMQVLHLKRRCKL